MGINVGGLQQRQEEVEKRRKESSGKEFYSLQDGKNSIRILPRSLKYFQPEGDDDFVVRYFVHYGLFDVDGYKMVVCGKTAGRSCPVCDELHKLSDKTLFNKLKARERFTYNVLDLNDHKIKILETGPKIYDELFKFVVSPEWGDLFNIQSGRNVSIDKVPAAKSSTGWTDYTVVPSPQQTDVSQMLPEGWDEEIDKLAIKIPQVKEHDELVRIVTCFKNGVSPASDDIGNRAAPVQQTAMPRLGTPVTTSAVPKINPNVNAVPSVGAPRVQQPIPTPQAVQQPQASPTDDIIASLPCYGEKYMPRDEKCKACAVKDSCRIKYLQV